ncbi:MAG TPA: hypothetical protein VFM18_06605 [Methanosarcina sp.]|nr:hypothetical protein [Methanosarcina sp.]
MVEELVTKELVIVSIPLLKIKKVKIFWRITSLELIQLLSRITAFQDERLLSLLVRKLEPEMKN